VKWLLEHVERRYGTNVVWGVFFCLCVWFAGGKKLMFICVTFCVFVCVFVCAHT